MALPVTCKVFTNHEGRLHRDDGKRVLEGRGKELCFKRNCLEDLLDATPFKKEDVISLHDPADKDLVKGGTSRTLTCKRSGRSATPS